TSVCDQYQGHEAFLYCRTPGGAGIGSWYHRQAEISPLKLSKSSALLRAAPPNARGPSNEGPLTRMWYERRGPESNRRIAVLQTAALPLGYRAEGNPQVIEPQGLAQVNGVVSAPALACVLT